jgi:nitrosocyanin
MKLMFLALVLALPMAAQAATQTINMVAVETGGAKFWFPSTITVKKGDTVKIKATSKIAAPNAAHGLAIDDFKVQEVIDDKGKTIEFVANKAGIFPIRCQMHPAHIGGQLVVLE